MTDVKHSGGTEAYGTSTGWAYAATCRCGWHVHTATAEDAGSLYADHMHANGLLAYSEQMEKDDLVRPFSCGSQKADWSAHNAAAVLPREKRQEFLDAIWSGLTLGEAREKAGVSFDAANGIMRQNIDNASYLRREAK